MVHPDGFDAMGLPVPGNRLGAAYEAIREMNPALSTEQAMTMAGTAAQAVERDRPYDVIHGGGEVPVELLDLTGRYRLLAHLCTEPPERS